MNAPANLPVLSTAQFHELSADLERPHAVQFFCDFREMLPGRVTRILRALREDDARAALDATLSLRITSSMTGALQMEHNCRQLQEGLRQGTAPGSLASRTRLAADTPPLITALEDLLAHQPRVSS